MKKALVIEASPELGRLIAAHLAGEGYDADTAGSITEGTKKLSAAPDLVFVDFELRKDDCLELLKKIRKQLPNAQLAGLVATPEGELIHKAQELGVTRFVVKRPSVTAFAKSLARFRGGGESEPSAKPRILVVDDEESIRTVLQRYLAGKGYEVETADDGDTALKTARSFKPMLVLLDVAMPRLSGIDTLGKLMDQDPDIGVIMVTGNIDEQKAKKCLELGASDYILKPFDFDYLETSVLAKIALLADAPPAR